jgi:23S rRNA (cytidine1920-2'-O)/16S rRNA (cytidine1409-2'-O)-methyltransferase
MDLSFISLKLVIPGLCPFLDDCAYVAVLIKPQFEAGKGSVGKNGIVKDKKTHVRVLKELCAFFGECGLNLQGMTYSPVKGGSGNIEYLALLNNSKSAAALPELNILVDTAFGNLKEN